MSDEPTTPRSYAVTCRHCGHIGRPHEDHSCPCPYPDEACPHHPAARQGGGTLEALTDSEREALLIAAHTVEPVIDTGNALLTTVERIIAARLAPAEARANIAERKVAAVEALTDDLHAQGWSQGPRYAARLRAALGDDA